MGMGWKFNVRDNDSPLAPQSMIVVKIANFDEAKAIALNEYGPTGVIDDYVILSEEELSEYSFSGLTFKWYPASKFEKLLPRY